MKLFVSLLFLSLSAIASPLKVEFDGNVEVQTRHTWNNPEAKKIAGANQNWKESQHSQFVGNIGFKSDYDVIHTEVNWFGRQAYSPLYYKEYAATQIYTFPSKLVARDVFKLQYNRVDGDHQTDSVLNKFFIEWKEENSLAFGRMFINYGLGEIFNPLNPFNQPTGLTSLNNVSQGSDGFKFTLNASENHSIEFYLLGDKNVNGYENELQKTIWVHGELKVNDELTLDYVTGEDQDRQKFGGQVSYLLNEALIFGQVLYQTETSIKNKSDHLWDILLGYDQQLTGKYHLRFEGGYQKKDPFASATSFSNRFLPTEYFASISNIYEIHPLVKLNGTFINDIKTGFTYFIGKSTWSMSDNIESELFLYSPVGKGSSTDMLAQKLITTDVGVALRAFF